MKRKKNTKKRTQTSKISNTKMMFLSLILLFIVFEALYIAKAQRSLQANSGKEQVAGIHTQR